jgi:hypothetical protein
MAQFRGTVEGSRSQVSRLGHKTSGLTTTCNGWNTGVECIARYNEEAERDEIMIFETSGSGYGGKRKHIHTVYSE